MLESLTRWEPATDNVGVAGYEVRLDNGAWTLAGGPEQRGWTFGGLQPNTTYTMYVRAFDAAGNRGPADFTVFSTTNHNSVGLQAEYYNNMDFTSLVSRQIDPTVNFNWGTGSPFPGMDADSFSVRWSGKVIAPTAGRYTFYTTTDDGVRLSVDNVFLVDKMVPQAATEWSGSINLTEGEHYLVMEYFERAGGASAKLQWSGPGISKQVIPESNLSPQQPSNSAVPDVPVLISATGEKTPEGERRIRIHYQPGDRTSDIIVERAPGGTTNFTEISRFLLDTIPSDYVDLNLPSNTSYTYRFRAYNDRGYSRYSNSLTATTPA